MPPPRPLAALRDATLGFGGRPLFESLSIALARGDKACLVGRNASGKSTLLKALAGQQPLDSGEAFLQPGTRAAYLPQDPDLPAGQSVAQFVAGGLPREEAERLHRIEAVLARLALDGARPLGELSGGEGRRAALARALVSDPEILLLDEPTNHLDLPTIAWLEEELRRYQGALLVVSHDRTFLAAVSRITFWLDRGEVKRLDKGYAHFEAWADEERAREEAERHRLDRRIVREERWLQRGVTARRRRNQGRLARLGELRRRRAEWLKGPGKAKLAAAQARGSGDLVIEAETLCKSFTGPDGKPVSIVRNFSTRIRRGDRIGIIGPNGAGKTTLLKLLTGELAPDSGSLRLGTRLQPLTFDQRRESLDPEATLWQTLVPGGGDSLMVGGMVGGRQRHVVGYLKDFLFDEGQARQPVKSLSGGEKNRLLLARLFARPSNLLLMDEPTNDLDLETLDLLLEMLDDYGGTLLLVSHDRDFLDRLVTGLIAVEGGGRIHEVVGGYSDYLAQRQTAEVTSPPAPRAAGAERPRRARQGGGKLGFREQRELDRLPGEIDRLTDEIKGLEDALADPGFYERDPAAFEAAATKLETRRGALTAAESRWLELEERREALAAAPGQRT
ncbi:MAG: ATP-binding cassette domain-containing protein [Rhodospirillales bacterium]|nr:ATP-binding cassette domain-containing protein [Rhodospirillales bacterium]